MAVHSSIDSEDDAVVIGRDDISNYNPDQILPEPPEEISKIRKWLQPTDYANENGEFRRHLASHMAGTSDWLTSSDTFRTWLESPTHGTLWIKGIPGSGKSVVAAYIIEHLRRNDPGTPLCYFFFRQIILSNHGPVALLRDWIDQVLVYSPPLQAKLKAIMEKRRSLSSLSMDDLWSHLRLALSNLPGKVVCVADALDEMDRGNDIFLQDLASFGQWKPHRIKVLMTSRPVSSVEVPLRQAHMLHMRLDENMVDADISSFVEQSLKENNRFTKAQRDLIRKAVPGNANGIFLYAKLAMDAFLQPEARIEDVLDTLPMDLHAMYTNLLRVHASRSGVPHDIQLLILQSVTHASRPLRLLELAEMICATYHKIGRSSSDISVSVAKGLVRAAAGPLLEILPDETVCVIHHSFTEYLKCMTRPEGDGGYPVLRPGETHARLALACLLYLQNGCLGDISVPKAMKYDLDNYNDREALYDAKSNSAYYMKASKGGVEVQKTALQHPFFLYAIDNWHIHIVKSAAGDYPQIDNNAALREFCNDAHRWRAWLKLRWSKSEEGSQGVTPLHAAARFGLVDFARELISDGADCTVVDAHGKTALWWAARTGHGHIIRLLVGAGADPNTEEKINGLTPLHVASSNNHADAITALLASGVDPLTPKTCESPGRRCGNAPRTRGHTPLMYACQNGHLKALVAFLPFITEISILHRALAWCAGSGRAALIARILQCPGIDVNAKVRGDTPLYRACSIGDRESIMNLLEAGADPAIFCEDSATEFAGMGCFRPIRIGQAQDPTRGRTALHAFCLSPRHEHARKDVNPEQIQEIVSALLEKGASVHQRTECGSTVLHRAVNQPVLLKILLQAGADANAVDDKGEAPLHRVTCADSIDLLLLEGMAELDKVRTSDGRSPLLCVLAQHNKEAILKLLSHSPRVKVRDANGDGPLHIALAQSSTDTSILQALLDAGADPNELNKHGKTPLLQMRTRSRDSLPIVDLLLQYGADINAKDPRGKTLLFQTVGNTLGSRHEHSEITQLLQRGADAQCRDYNGKTLLHHAVATHDLMIRGMRHNEDTVTRLDFILGLGLDQQALDYNGNTIFHEAALRSGVLDDYYAEAHIELFEKLFALGISPDQGNFQGRTVLHVLAATPGSRSVTKKKSGHSSPLDWLLTKTKDIDQRDLQGLTALHLASTVSEHNVKDLLDAGASCVPTSFDDLTPLHLAVRARQSNIVGLLLHHQSYLREGLMIDAKDKKGHTPLHHACRSGMAETVRTLLDFGANASDKSLWSSCAEFHTEQAFWNQDRSSEYKAANQHATGLTIDDRARRGSSDISRESTVNIHSHIPRLDEIIHMLICNGCDTSSSTVHSWSSITSALSSSADPCAVHTLRCFMQAQETVHGKALNLGQSGTYEERLVKAQERAQIALLPTSPYQLSGQANEAFLQKLLKKREYYAITALFDLGFSFLDSFDRYQPTSCLNLLASHGYASLLENIGTLEAKRAFGQGIWHAHGDKSVPGLHREIDAEVLNKMDQNSYNTILNVALARILPNMDVVRLLVEKFHVDVNQPDWHKPYQYADSKTEWIPRETPLQSLSRAQHWWHVSMAIPYLISRGANLNAKRADGRTALHIAIGGSNNYVGLFHKLAAETLVQKGADPNAQDNQGNSCLALAAGNFDLARLLINHGASVDANALFEAISAEQVSVVQLMLNAGADPNVRRAPAIPIAEPAKNSTVTRKSRQAVDEVPDHEEYPLYAAASSHEVSWQVWKLSHKKQAWDKHVQLVHALLRAGANPFAEFEIKTSPKPEQARDSDFEDECGLLEIPILSTGSQRTAIILHELLSENHLVHPILQLEDLDATYCDAQGRTLLHIACHHHALTAPIDALYEGVDKDYRSTLPSFLDCLLDRGADPLAKDSHDRNILHHVFFNEKRRQNHSRDLDSLKLIMQRYPTLLNEPDAFGNTPLHMALKYAVLHDDIVPAQAMLDADADPFATNNDGDGCLHILAFRFYRHPALRSLFKSLLNRGLSINHRNKRGETPIFNLNKHLRYPYSTVPPTAGTISAKKAISLFKGADLHAQDNDGRGLLHIAARHTREPEPSRFNLERFSHDNDSKGVNTPELSIARFKVLLQLGLDPMMEDKQKRTALDVAAAFGKKSVLALFDKDYVRNLQAGKVKKEEQEREENEDEDEDEDFEAYSDL